MKPQPNFKRIEGVILLYGLIIFISIAFAVSWRFETRYHPPQSHQELLIPLPDDHAGNLDKRIEVGLLINNIYNFEAGQKTFDVDGWVWLKWSADLEKLMKAQDTRPQDLFYFFNQVNGYDSTMVPGDLAPKLMPDGRYYAKFQFSGHFFANVLDFRKFPFQTLKLPIALEIKSGHRLGLNEPLTMQLDHENSGVGAYIDMGGYTTLGFKLAGYTHQYESTLGDPSFLKEPRRISQARMEIAYKKAPVATFVKIFLPLVSVMVLSLLSPSIFAPGWEVRVGIPPTALLSLIFLQQTYENWIPELPYITFLDTIYNACYITNMILFGLFLWGSNAYNLASEEDKASVVARIDKLDSYFQKGLFVFIIFSITTNWYMMGVKH